jgi:hypothetical protein
MDRFSQRRRPHHEVRPVLHWPTIVFVTVCAKDRRAILASAKVHNALIET